MVFKCKMCDAALNIREGDKIATCEYCGTTQTVPQINSERIANLYDRAGHYRKNNEFDKALALYEEILNECPTDAEAYWSIILCQYGIEYVEEGGKRIPTINRTQVTSIYDDQNYKAEYTGPKPMPLMRFRKRFWRFLIRKSLSTFLSVTRKRTNVVAEPWTAFLQRISTTSLRMRGTRYSLPLLVICHTSLAPVSLTSESFPKTSFVSAS